MSRGRCRVRVRYSDTDAMGVAHHTRHLAWFEVGRTELMRAAGVVYADMEKEGWRLPLVGAEIRYQAPARYDDELEIATRVERRTAVRLTFVYRITRAADGVVVADGTTDHALVDREFRPTRFPRSIAAVLDGDAEHGDPETVC